jgi:hypothetical protein
VAVAIAAATHVANAEVTQGGFNIARPRTSKVDSVISRRGTEAQPKTGGNVDGTDTKDDSSIYEPPMDSQEADDAQDAADGDQVRCCANRVHTHTLMPLVTADEW